MVLWILLLPITAFAYDVDWVRQFGSPQADQAKGVYTDSRGTYAAGEITVGTHVDAFVRKYNAQGTLQWTRQFGTDAQPDGAVAVTGDDSGIYVVGYINSALPGQTQLGSVDSFLRKYDENGQELWTRQFGTIKADVAAAVSVDDTGIYVAGFSNGTFAGQSAAGMSDAFLVKFSLQGTQLWVSQWGSNVTDQAFGVAADKKGGVAVVGATAGNLAGTNLGLTDVCVRRFSTSGAVLWTRQFGTPMSDSASAVAADRSGIYVGGLTAGSLSPAGNAGGYDGFVRRYSLDGTADWTKMVRNAGYNDVAALALVDGALYAGGSTEGVLPGEKSAGLMDAFVRRYECDGSEDWTVQFGTKGSDVLRALSVRGSRIMTAGSTDGQFAGQTQLGQGDAFVAKVNE